MVFNARSLCNKTFGVCEFLKTHKCDVCFVTEAWIKKKNESIIAEIKDTGYDIKFQPRRGSKRGGGVCVLFKPCLNIDKCNISTNYKSFEVLQTTIKSSHTRLCVSTFYRTGQLSVKKRKDFLNEFEMYIDSLLHLEGEHILCGDLNIHVEDTSSIITTSLLSITESFGFSQIVNESTHREGGILDLLFLRNSGACKDIAKQSLFVHDVCFSVTSDHSFVECLVPFFKDAPKPPEVKSYRNFKDISAELFCHDFKELLEEICSDYFDLEVDEAVKCFNDVLLKTLDQHAPVIEKQFVEKKTTFTTPEILRLRRLRRKSERMYRKFKKHSDLMEYRYYEKQVQKCVKKSRNSHYKDNLAAANGDKKKKFKLLNDMLGKRKSVILPDNSSDAVLSEDFEDYFTSKIKTIRSNINTAPSEDDDYPDISKPFDNNIDYLNDFSALILDELDSILSSVSNKHCELDIIPTPTFKRLYPYIRSYILHIVNSSLTTGIFPKTYKKSLLKPSIKNKDLDKNVYANYRPISNLCFPSKLIEKCVLDQLVKHLEKNDLFGSFQSAYRKFHSCETAIAKISNDILTSLDNNEAEFLIFLDLSSAFDTVDHSMLLEKLHKDFYISGTVLSWLKSYLSDRTYSVKIGIHISNGVIALYGVPQGSILGPILFLLYIAEIENIAKMYGFKIHMYADDMQLYISFQRIGVLENMGHIEHCLRHIKHWMSKNFLKINESKTKLLMLTPKRYLKDAFADLCISFGGNLIYPEPDAVNLGITFDSNMTMDRQIKSVTSKGYFYLTNFYRVADKLTVDLKLQLITTYILPLVDYCNVIYTCASQDYCQKLQKLLNSAVRFIFNLTSKKKRCLSLTPYFMQLHILPVRYRIIYKLCLLVFKSINGLAPNYLSNLISQNAVCSSLRSSSDFYALHTIIPKTSYGESAFSFVAPYQWNKLPIKIRESPSIGTFKMLLKTHLFHECFGNE